MRLFSSSGCLYFDFGCFIFDTTKGLGEGVALVLMRTAAKNGIEGMSPGYAPLSPPQITDRLTGSPNFFPALFPSQDSLRSLGNRGYCWFSHDVTKIQPKKLSILPRFYFHDALKQLKTNCQTNFRFKRVLGFVIEYA